MSYKKVMAGSLGVVAALGVFAIVGVAPTQAATTTVEVNVNEECLIGDGLTGTDYEGVGQLSVSLSAATPYDETAATSGDQLIGTVCNAEDGYSITETVDHTGLMLSANSGGPYTGAVGFNVGAGNAALASFAANTWSIKYADVTGTSVVSAAQTYARSPSTGGTVIATTSAPTALTTFSQQFGALTDGTVSTGYYGAVITYSLIAN
jgi:hypothetical protein